jgi:glycosyltransferase involved in cell wall biosynthesis
MGKIDLSTLKIAIVCDWLTNQGGAEHVVWTMHEMFPSAPIYTSIYNKEKLPQFKDADVRTSFLQKRPFAKTHHQWFLNAMPRAFEEFDLKEYDIVLSSAHSCAKGVITKPETVHMSYCHTPMRYAWDESHEYINKSPFPGFLKQWYIPHAIKKIRLWDRLAADRVEYFIANSKYIQKRIKKYYERDSTVIYPPVETGRFSISPEIGDYFLAVGRLIQYKRFDLIVETFNQLGLPLKIVGEGPEYKKLKSIAKSNIEFLGFVSEEELPKLYSQAQALIFPQREDFGIVPVESMASGRPVIAFQEGGAKETVIDGMTGIFFEEQTIESLSNAIQQFQHTTFVPEKIRQHALQFDTARFKREMMFFIQQKYQEWQNILDTL